jgi:hypothetical protein
VAVCNFLGEIFETIVYFGLNPFFLNPVYLYVPSVLASGSPPIGLVVVVVVVARCIATV